MTNLRSYLVRFFETVQRLLQYYLCHILTAGFIQKSDCGFPGQNYVFPEFSRHFVHL